MPSKAPDRAGGVIVLMARTKNPHIDVPVSDPQAQSPPGLVVTVIGMLIALWCLGFAVVNLVFEISGHFASGAYAHYTSGISVMNWLVVGLKVVGAAVALLSIARRPRLVSPAVVTVLVWAAFATLAVYGLGSVAEAVGMGLGLIGGIDQIDMASIGYVLFFLAAAVGYGVLAISYSRRHPRGKGLAVLAAAALAGPAAARKAAAWAA